MAIPSDLLRGATSPISTLSSGTIKPIAGTPQAGFGHTLESAISSVETDSAQAHQAVARFLSGDSIDIHSVAIASQRAEVSMELFQQVRNKVVSAYQEIMRSQM